MAEVPDVEICEALAIHCGDDAEMVRLLDCCVGRVLRKIARRGGDWTVGYDGGQIAHIVEWLRIAIDEEHDWIGRTNAAGHPRKLMKFSGIDDIVREVDKFFRRRTLSGRSTSTATDEETVFQLPDGYSIVRMLSPAALDREGLAMGHCVGAGSYDANLATGAHLFFSLRDAKGEPHVTMQVVAADKQALQVKGKQNEPPIHRYMEMVKTFGRHHGYNMLPRGPGDAYELTSPDGDVYDLERLPDHLVVRGWVRWAPLRLNEFGINRWPTTIEVQGNALIDMASGEGPLNLIVTGTLTISGARAGHRMKTLKAGRITIGRDFPCVLPEQTEVEEDLLAESSHLAELPDGLLVGKKLNISHTGVIALPSALRCGSLHMEGTRITSLPRDIRIESDLFARASSLRILPEGFNVEEGIDLRDTAVKVLPQNLECTFLDISSTSVRRLPASASIHYGLVARSSRLESIPNARHLASLDVSECPIERFPSGMEVDGLTANRMPRPLDLSAVRVSGELLCQDTVILAFPSPMEVEDTIDLAMSVLPPFPETIRCTDLRISCCVIDALPSRPEISGDIDARHSTLNFVHDLSKVEGIIDLTETCITELPSGLHVPGSLVLDGSAIEALPEGLSVGGDLTARSTEISSIGRSIVIGGSADFTRSTVDRKMIWASGMKAEAIFDEDGHDTTAMRVDKSRHTVLSWIVRAFETITLRKAEA